MGEEWAQCSQMSLSRSTKFHYMLRKRLRYYEQVNSIPAKSRSCISHC